MEPKRVPDAPVPVIFRRGQFGEYLRAIETGLGNAVGPGRNGSGNAVGPEAVLSALPFGATHAFLSA